MFRDGMSYRKNWEFINCNHELLLSFEACEEHVALGVKYERLPQAPH